MKPLVCRVNPRMWWLVALGLGEMLFLLVAPYFMMRDAPHPVPWWGIAFLLCVAWGMGGLIGWAALILGADLWRGEIRADEDGLRWRRRFGPQQSARWDEIHDFYLSSPPNGRRTGSGWPTVETAHGNLELGGNFDGIEAIVALVPHRALSADAKIWRMRATDTDAEWEQTVRLWTPAHQWALLWAAFFPLCAVLLPVGVLIQAGPAKPPLGNFWFDVTPSIMGALFFGGLGALCVWMALTLWCERNFAWRHRGHTLRMNARGVVFRDENQSIEARWDEIQSAQRLEKVGDLAGAGGFGRARVQTARGEFVLIGALWSEFQARCGHYAPEVLPPTSPEAQSQSLDFELNPTPLGADGARTFSFATVGNRLLALLFSLVLSVAPLLYLLVGYSSALSQDEPFSPSWPLFGALCALAILVTGALWLWFTRAFIVATDEELRLHWPLCAPRSVPWASITETGADAWGDWVRTDGRKVYWALGLFPARRGELRALIEEKRRPEK